MTATTNPWRDLVKINVTEKQALEVIQERANGVITFHCNPDDTLKSFTVEGELCLDELEAAFVVLLAKSPEPYLLGNWLDDKIKSDSDFRRLEVLADPRHGISAQAAYHYRITSAPGELSVIGTAPSKGGRVWIDSCGSLAALQAVIIELNWYCERNGYEPTHVEQSVENMETLQREQDAEDPQP